MPEKKPRPVSINLKKKSRLLNIDFDDESSFELSCELLRVYSPSAEVRGHGPGQEILQLGKENVSINEVEAVGNYAVKLVFDDGHDSGIYTWDFLYDLGTKHDDYWKSYLHALAHAGHERKPQ
ncbi:MAG: DUF971 domain-containing protein [Gammaproteobacteria bacterium]|jgi:DUF971 family protein|nr:DUF971 domain-containing protein [Gammaproteobacteria bacterium]